MQNQNDFSIIIIDQTFLDQSISVPDIHSRIRKVPLDDALDQIKDDAIREVVDSSDRPAECEGQPVQVPPQPVLPTLLISLCILAK